MQKILDKLNAKRRAVIFGIWQKIINNDIANLKPKKLAGFSNYYRIRSGKLRLVYKVEDGQNILVNIDHRKDIYKNL